MSAEKVILAAVARADLWLYAAWEALKPALCALLIGAALRAVIRKERGK